MTPDVEPAIEEQLRTALHEIATCVSVDRAGVTEPEEIAQPRTRRARALVTVGVAVVLAIGVALTVKAVRSPGGSGTRSPVPTPAASGARYVDEGALTTPRIYRRGFTALLPPAPGTQPRVTAAEAYAARSGYPWRQEPRTPHLVLALVTISDYGTQHADGTFSPVIDRRLAWVVTYADVPVGSLRPIGGGPRRKVGAPTSSTAAIDPATPSGETVLILVDATSGQPIDAEGFPGSFTTPAPLACPPSDPPPVPHQKIAGTASRFVPGNPIDLLACRYQGFEQPHPAESLAGAAHIDPRPIANAFNAATPIPQGTVFHCALNFSDRFVLIFEYADSSRLRVSIGDSGCGFASNGDLRASPPPAILTQLQGALGP